jgi:hypothetical protein
MNRRTFAVTAVSALSAARVAGANDRIRMGLIGSGGRGREDWGTFLKQPDVEPAAVCDVYDPFREKGIANADVERGHRSPVTCHLGNISTRLGRSIRGDAAKEQAVGDAEANQMLSRPYRGPWKI